MEDQTEKEVKKDNQTNRSKGIIGLIKKHKVISIIIGFLISLGLISLVAYNSTDPETTNKSQPTSTQTTAEPIKQEPTETQPQSTKITEQVTQSVDRQITDKPKPVDRQTTAQPIEQTQIETTEQVTQPIESEPELTVPIINSSEQTSESEPISSTKLDMLKVAVEYSGIYDRDDWGERESDLCQTAIIGGFTGMSIDSCDVDHVVSLKEAHESGGHSWNIAKKQQFSQDPANHLAVRSCVNRSKASRDAGEWTKEWIARSKACEGGYELTDYCLLAKISYKIKLKYSLTIDDTEAKVMSSCQLEITTIETQPKSTETKESETQPKSPVVHIQPTESCTHWHAGHKKHTHPGTNHDGTHKSGKCADF